MIRILDKEAFSVMLKAFKMLRTGRISRPASACKSSTPLHFIKATS